MLIFQSSGLSVLCIIKERLIDREYINYVLLFDYVSYRFFFVCFFLISRNNIQVQIATANAAVVFVAIDLR